MEYLKEIKKRYAQSLKYSSWAELMLNEGSAGLNKALNSVAKESYLQGKVEGWLKGKQEAYDAFNKTK